MIGRADKNGPQGDGINEDVSFTLNTIDRHAVSQPILLESNQNHASIRTDGVCTTLPAAMGMGGGYTPMVCAGFKVGNSAQARGVGYADEQAPTLGGECGGNKAAVVYDARGNGDGVTVPTIVGDHNGKISDYTSIILNDQGGSSISADDSGVAPTIRAEMHGNVPCVMKAFGEYEVDDAASSLKSRDYKSATDLIVGVNCRNGTESAEINGTIQAHSNGGQSLNCNQVVRVRRIVRRLTPLECERLQGFPDGWTDIGEWVDSKGKRHKPADTPRYKALGNSIALPPWKWVLKRLCAQYERDATMASLFDGIGGFPLIWEQLNGRGSCLWASEIEEFPMAVTKRRIGDGR